MYNNHMDVEFDPAKDQANRAKHGVSLALAADFDFAAALFIYDDRHQYGEDRWRATGFIGERLFFLVFVETDTGIRAISLRKATKPEAQAYAKQRP